jgi:hypothetical protein
MTPAERCAAAIAAGKYKTVEAWSAAVIVSEDQRIPEEWRKWASRQLDELVGYRRWAHILKARKEAGFALQECQLRALSQALPDDQIGTD